MDKLCYTIDNERGNETRTHAEIERKADMKRIELIGVSQRQLEHVTHNKIHAINTSLKKAYAIYKDWEHADDKTKRVYKTPDDFKARVLDRLSEDRRYYVYKLRDIRRGSILE